MVNVYLYDDYGDMIIIIQFNLEWQSNILYNLPGHSISYCLDPICKSVDIFCVIFLVSFSIHELPKQ